MSCVRPLQVTQRSRRYNRRLSVDLDVIISAETSRCPRRHPADAKFRILRRYDHRACFFVDESHTDWLLSLPISLSFSSLSTRYIASLDQRCSSHPDKGRYTPAKEWACELRVNQTSNQHRRF